MWRLYACTKWPAWLVGRGLWIPIGRGASMVRQLSCSSLPQLPSVPRLALAWLTFSGRPKSSLRIADRFVRLPALSLPLVPMSNPFLPCLIIFCLIQPCPAEPYTLNNAHIYPHFILSLSVSWPALIHPAWPVPYHYISLIPSSFAWKDVMSGTKAFSTVHFLHLGKEIPREVCGLCMHSRI